MHVNITVSFHLLYVGLGGLCFKILIATTRR